MYARSGRPYSRSAYARKFPIARGTSTVEARSRGLPVSATSASTNSSNRSWTPSAIRRSAAARSPVPADPHAPFSAARAAATASSTTSRVASGTEPSSVPSTGATSGKAGPSERNTPPT